jgi:hypothetical protein
VMLASQISDSDLTLPGTDPVHSGAGTDCWDKYLCCVSCTSGYSL